MRLLQKRKAILAAAGNHNLLMMGPPGSGKTELAKCIHSLLPDLTEKQKYEVEKIHRSCGEKLLKPGRPPWRAPHISTGAAGFIGSWSSKSGVGVVPGEWSLAHRGVLFIDEWSEFSKSALEACRVPMETGGIALARAAGSIEMPAKALLIAALNPCPCGRLTDEFNVCFCVPAEVRRYLKKLSGPVADRFGIHVELGNERKIAENDDKTSNYDKLSHINELKSNKNTQKSGKDNNYEIHEFSSESRIRYEKLKKRIIERFKSFLNDKKRLFVNNWVFFKEMSSFENWFSCQIDELTKNDKTAQNGRKMSENYKYLLYNCLKSLFIEEKLKTEWNSIRANIAGVRQWSDENNRKLDLSADSEHWFNSFLAISGISEIGRMHVLDVAQTAALIDGMEIIKFNHIVEAAEGRLFNRMSWLTGANDGTIPKYRKELRPKFEPCNNKIP